MLKKFMVFSAGILIAGSAMAAAVADKDVDKSIELKNGSTVYFFKGGKMGMEDKLGRPVRMKRGQVMETKDGEKIMMVGDEVMRLEQLQPKN